MLHPASTQPITIRKLKAADLPALEWEGAYVHFRRVYADVFRRQQKGTTIMWVAAHPDGVLVGQVFVQLVGSRTVLADGLDRAYLYSVRVKPFYRNQGLGTQLVETAEADLIRRGFTYTTLNVEKINPDARRLYERLGYAVVAHEPGRWSYIDHRGRRQNVHEPAWRMQKKIR